MKNFGIIIGVVVIAFIGLIGYMASQKESVRIEITQTPEKILAIDEQDYVQGSLEATVVIHKFSDLECPACAAYNPIIKEVVASNSDRVAYVYRHFPLYFHPNAKMAARAVEAAGKQGKYPDMIDLIFADQSTWSGKPENLELFAPYAESLELDMAQWRADANSEEVKRFVDVRAAEAQALGVNSTPTFFINGEKIINPRSVEEFEALIDVAMTTNGDDSEETASTSTSTASSTN